MTGRFGLCLICLLWPASLLAQTQRAVVFACTADLACVTPETCVTATHTATFIEIQTLGDPMPEVFAAVNLPPARAGTLYRQSDVIALTASPTHPADLLPEVADLERVLFRDPMAELAPYGSGHRYFHLRPAREIPSLRGDRSAIVRFTCRQRLF